MAADLVIRNGRVYAPSVGEPYSAIAVKDGKILALDNSDGICYIDENTKVIDAGGNSVLPGFTDAHLHATMCTELYITKLIYDEMDREPGESREDYIQRMLKPVGEYAKENPELPIIRATGWNPAAFQTDKEGHPTRHDLDKICRDRPVMLRSYDHHCILVNSKALEMAGIDRDTQTPRNGVVERDSDGDPTGFFQELTAIGLFLDSLEIADFSVEEYKEGIRKFQSEYAFPYGITAIFDAYATENAIEAYRQLAQMGELQLRVRTAILADPSKPIAQFDQMVAAKGKYDVGDSFKIETVKFFCDGEGMAFYMNEPFEAQILRDKGYEPDYRGYPQWTEEEMKEAFLILAKGDYQIHVHAMGDGAVKQTLNAFEYVENHGASGKRNSIAHVMNIDEADIDRMAKLDVIGSIQPAWPVIDYFVDYLSIPLLGRKRAYEQYPIGRLKKAGVVVASGTDFPIVTDLNPMLGIQIGMTRTTPKQSPNYEQYKDIISGPEENPQIECMSLDEMIESYTLSGAYQLFLENKTGSIAVGKSADLVILDSVVEDMDPMDIGEIQVRQTIFCGKVVKE